MTVSEEEKKAGIWEFQGKKFRRCPTCDKAILAEWKSHTSCGWGKEEIKEEKPKEDIDLLATTLVGECISEAKDILANAFKKNDGEFYNIEHILQIADQIRRTKIALKLD